MLSDKTPAVFHGLKSGAAKSRFKFQALAICAALLAFATTGWGQVNIPSTGTFVTTSWDGWNGTAPTGFTQNRTYQSTTANTAGGTYAIANSGFGWQATGTAPFTSVEVVGTFRNTTGSAQTSVTIEYDAFQIVSRASRTPGWTVTSSLGTVSALNWTFDSSKSAASPAVQTVSLTGLSVANNGTFTVTWASDRGAGSGSSPLIGLRNVKVKFNAAATPTITGAATASVFTTTYGSASTAQPFSVSGSNLTADLTAAAQTGFEVATTQNGTYGASVTFTQSSGSASGTVWARLKSNAAASASAYNGVTAVALTSGATQANITTAGSGNVVAKATPSISAAPTASAITYGQTLASSLLTGGTGSLAGSFAFTSPTTAPSAGTANQGVTFTPSDTANYNTQTTTVSVTVNKANQTITFGSLPAKNFGDANFNLSATASSGLTVSYSSSNTGVATVSGNTVTIVSAGTTTITASQAGDSNYNAASATQTFTVTASSGTLSTSTGSLSALTATPYGTASAPANFTVNGTGLDSSGVTVTPPAGFEVSTTSNFAAVGTSASPLSLGTSATLSITVYVRLAASTVPGSYSGNISVAGGAASTQTVAIASSTVTKANQPAVSGSFAASTITFGQTGSVTGSGGSGTGAYELRSTGGTATVTISGATISPTTVGTADIEIRRLGDASYNASEWASVGTFTINKANQIISSVETTVTKTFGDPNYSLGASVNSGLTLSFSSDNSAVATVNSAGLVTIIGAGSANISVSQAGNDNYNAATSATQALTVNKANQTITFGALVAKTTADVPFALTATTTAPGLTVGYTSSNLSVATVSGSTVTIVGPGTTTITASQAGNSNHNAATIVQQTLTVSAVPTLTEVYVPQFMEGGMGSTNSKRIPYAYRVTLTNLNPSTTYRYYNSAVIDADTATSTGAGNPIFVTDTGNFVRSTGGSLSTVGNYSTLTTDANGSYTGWFMLEPTANATRFQVSGNVKMRIILNSGVSGNTTATTFLTTASYVAVTPFGSAVANGTAIRGSSSASAKSFVLLYDNTTGTGRPLAATVVEGDGVANTTANSYASFYATNVDEQSGAWGAIIPNNLANGVRRIENREKADGSLLAFNTDSDGAWASGVNTVNPAGGDTTPLVITSSDAPLAPAIATSGTLASLSTTYGTPSDSTAFSVSGSNMRAGILVAPPTGFEVSADNSSFSATVTVGSAGTIDSTTVYVRLAGTASAGSKSGNIVLSSSGAANVNVATITSTVAKATPTISVAPTASAITYGQTLASSSLTVGTASTPGTYAFTTSSTAPSAGTANQAVTFTPADAANYNTASTTASVTVNPLSITGSFTANNKNYDGTTSAVVVTRSLSGVLSSDAANVSLTGGTAAFATANVGTGITVTLTGAALSGAAAANYSLSFVSDTTANISAMSVNPDSITVTPPADLTYNGSPKEHTATASVSGGFTFSYTGVSPTVYGASSTAPTAAGNYRVTLTPIDSNYSGSKSVDFTIAKATLTPVFSGNASPAYDGSAKSLNAVTTPETTVNLTYDGSSTAPTSAGIYSVVATVNDTNYQGTATTSLVIGEAAQTITFGSLPAVTYSVGATLNLTATASSGLEVSYASSDTTVATISGNIVTILKAGVTDITASQVGDNNYNAAPAVTRTLTVNPASQADVSGTLALATITFGNTTTVTASGGTGTGAYEFRQNGGTGSVGFTGTGVSRTITPTAVGTAVIEVRRVGDTNYNDSSWVAAGTLTVNLAAPSGLAYANISGTVGTAITNVNPTVTGTVDSYSVSPALPQGLSLNTVTGVISGTPLVTAASAIYTVTATNAGGNTTTTLTVAVLPVVPSDLSYANINGTVGTAITNVNPTVSGTVDSYSISPALPAGLLLNTGTGVISGTPSAAAASAIYTVTATNAGGYASTTLTIVVGYAVGPVAVADSLTKPVGNAGFLIPVSQLLANDYRITNSSGATATSGLTITAVTSGSGNSVVYNVGDLLILFTPSSASTDTITYTVSYGGMTATGTVTITTETEAPTFRLQIVKVGAATFAGGNTTVTHDFIGVPNQTYLVEYTTNLENGPWTSAGNQSTGTTGSFSVNFTTSGDVAADWTARMFFRARLVR